jgi:hypothetical protein
MLAVFLWCLAGVNAASKAAPTKASFLKAMECVHEAAFDERLADGLKCVHSELAMNDAVYNAGVRQTEWEKTAEWTEFMKIRMTFLGLDMSGQFLQFSHFSSTLENTLAAKQREVYIIEHKKRQRLVFAQERIALITPEIIALAPDAMAACKSSQKFHRLLKNLMDSAAANRQALANKMGSPALGAAPACGDWLMTGSSDHEYTGKAQEMLGELLLECEKADGFAAAGNEKQWWAMVNPIAQSLEICRRNARYILGHFDENFQATKRVLDTDEDDENEL